MTDIHPKAEIPHHVRLQMGVKKRNLEDAVGQIREEFDFAVETFNDKHIHKSPDKIGITIYYPDKRNPTHFMSEIFPIGIGEKGLQRQSELMKKKLRKKIA